MRLTILLPALLAVISSIIFAPAAQAQACSCPGVDFKETVKGADTIVIGEIEGQTDYGLLVRVERYFKSGGPSEIAVHDLTIESGCPSVSTAAKPGDRYQLYLDSDAELDLPYITTYCDRHLLLEPGQPDDVHLLGLERYAGPSIEPDRLNPPREAMWLAAALIPLAFLAAATLAPSRRR